MSQPDGKIRPWRQIARELAEERDSQRILALSKELNHALLAQGVDAALVEPHLSRPSTTTDSGKATNDYDRSVSENSSFKGATPSGRAFFARLARMERTVVATSSVAAWYVARSTRFLERKSADCILIGSFA